MTGRVTDLTINIPIRQPDFTRELEAREQRRVLAEQHWAGRAGKGGDIGPASRLTLHELMLDRGGEMCDRLMSERGWSEADFRYAASRFEETGDPGLRELARHLRAMEMFASEASEKEMAQMANAQESMTRRLIDGLGEAYREDQGRRWPANNAGKVHEPLGLPRTGGYAPYPTATRPEPVDEDRAARGAREAPLSDRIRGLAREMERLSSLATNGRQMGRLKGYAARLRAMAQRQYARELESEITTADDDAGAELSGLADDAARDAANDNGDGDGDHPEFRSFDSWDDENRAGSEGRARDDVRDQLLDEDIPTMPDVPRAGRRVDEDDLGDASLHSDDVPGRRKNISTHLALPKGNVYRGKPAGRYSAFKQSMRESGGLDLTAEIIEDQKLNWYGSHGCF